jgi:NNP family nitrate/nitrite transporter-like MFS transporter
VILGAFVFIFAVTESLGGTIAVLVFFSFFLHAAEGSTFGMIPYVQKGSTGTIIGLVGAGGYGGAAIFTMCFQILDHRTGFFIMGTAALIAAALSPLLNIKGEKGQPGTMWANPVGKKKKNGIPGSVVGEDESQTNSTGRRRGE